MNKLNATIAVYSKATALVQTLISEQATLGGASSMSLDYSHRKTSNETQGLDKVDALIYDLSLVGEDMDRAATDILQLKIKCGNKPLILIGSRHALAEAEASPRIKPEIAHTISKPLSTSQLRLVSEAVIIKHDLSHLTSDASVSSHWRLVTGVAVAASLFIAAFFAWTSTTPMQSVENVAIVDASTNMRNETSTIAKSTQSDSASIIALTKLATLASHQGRLAFPLGDNALNYYDQILDIDNYHDAAYRGRQNTLKQLDGSLAILMSDGNFSKAETLLEVLINAEPFNDQYRRIDLALRNQKYARLQASVKVAANQRDVADSSNDYLPAQ